jgi:hypothetical protein
MSLEATLKDYPTVKYASVAIRITVIKGEVACKVTSLNPPFFITTLPVESRSSDGKIVSYKIAPPKADPACGYPPLLFLKSVDLIREPKNVSRRIPHSRGRNLQAPEPENPVLPYGLTCSMTKQNCEVDNNKISSDILSVKLGVLFVVENRDLD